MPTARAMTLLEHHVPLSLLLDLMDPQGPSSTEIFHREPPTSLTRSG
jgi:hypothetical protein